MLLTRRIFLLCFAAFGLAACAGPAPTTSALDAASRDNIVIADVAVDVAKMGAQTQGRPVPSSSVKSLLEREAASQLRGQGKGNRKVRAVLAIDNVNIITAGQSILVGGESTMSGTVSLVDPRSGQTLLAPTKVTSGGGGWVAGGLIAAATRDDAATELRQMSNEFVARARILTVGDPLTVSSNSVANAQPTEQEASSGQDAASSEAERKTREAELKCRQSISINCKKKLSN